MRQMSIFNNVSTGVERTVSYATTMNDGHMHDKNELFFLVDGNMIATCNTDSIEIVGPTVLIFNSYSIHSGGSLDDKIYDRYKIFFEDDILEGNSSIHKAAKFFKDNHLTVIQLDEEKKQILLSLFARAIDYADDIAAQKYISIWIIYELSRWQSDQNTVALKAKTAYINQIMHYLAQNYHTDITLESLASKYYVSRAKLVSDFKKVTGVTVKRYLSLVRLNNAKAYLASEKSISETATLCGYSDESYFISKFKQYFHITPGEYCKRKSIFS